MAVMERGMGVALAGLRRLAGVEALDRLGIRDRVERSVHLAVKHGFGTAARASRAFARSGRGGAATRPAVIAPRPLFDLTPTDEQQMIQQTFREFGVEVLRVAAPAADAASAAPAEVLAQTRELGALLLGIPSALGGVVDERSAVTTVLAAEALAYGDLGLAAAALAPAAVATALALWGDGDQQDTYLPAFVGDDPPAAALCLMEPRPLHDPMAPATTARRDGEDWVLDGVKSLVPRVAEAELLLVSAAIEGSEPGLFLLESSTPGITVRPEPTMGARAMASGELALAGVRIPASARLGADVPGLLGECVARSRVAWSALAVGTSQAVLDYLIPYVNTRHAFGEPISHRQAVAFGVADIAIELDGMRLATWRAASLADQGKPFAEAAAIARTLVRRKAMDIGSQGVQLLGGHGYVKEHPVERWYRDLRGAGLAEGALLV